MSDSLPHVVMLAADDLRDNDRVRRSAVAAQRAGARVTLLALTADPDRSDSLMAGVHIIRLPASTTYADAAAKARLRRRRARRITGYASATAARQAIQRAEHSRVRRFVVRARSAGQRRLDALQQKLIRRLDRLIGNVRIGARWRRLLPEVLDYEAIFAPAIDELAPDLVHVHGVRLIGVGAHAVARARAQGRTVALVYVAGGETGRTPRETAAWRQLEREFAKAADRTVAPSPSTDESGPLPALDEGPYRVDRGGRAFLSIGPANMAGQAWAWGRAAERFLPDLDVEVFAVDRGSLQFPADVVVPVSDFARSRSWQQAWSRHLRTECTHVLMEAGRPVMGRLNGGDFAADVEPLRRAGVAVALAFHGSEIRDPARHAARYPWSPFKDPDEELTARLQRQIAVLMPLVEAFDGPKFVSTPDLLDDVTDAIWLPVVVDPDLWLPGEVPLQRPRPLVVHAPSRRALKGTHLIEPVIESLVERGLVDYRRVEGVAPAEVPAIIRSADIVLDHFGIGNYGVLTCEAMASGRVTISHIADNVRARVPVPIPTIEATPDTLATVIEKVLDDRATAQETAALGPAFVREWHDGRRSAAALAPFLGRSVDNG